MKLHLPIGLLIAEAKLLRFAEEDNGVPIRAKLCQVADMTTCERRWTKVPMRVIALAALTLLLALVVALQQAAAFQVSRPVAGRAALNILPIQACQF